MLLLLFTIAVLIAAIVGLKKVEWYDDVGWLVSASSSVIATIVLIVEIIIIICDHAGVDPQIQQYEIEYQSLLERREIAQSEYEDISKSDIVTDISEWNKMVISAEYWSHNPWTSCFYSQKVVDSLKVIE